MYVRTEESQGKVKVEMVTSKSKIAPQKMLTIPRMELEACKIGAKTAIPVAKALGIDPSRIRYWTDSEVANHWIRKSPHAAKVFVSHRVAQIQACPEIKNWGHVSSGENPADFITRGMSVEQLKNAEMWWNGPEFLKEGIDKWPKWTKKTNESILESVASEMVKPKGPIVVMLAHSSQNGQEREKEEMNLSVLETHSSMRSAFRVTAYVFRFIQACKDAIQRRKGGKPVVVNAVGRKRTAARIEGKPRRKYSTKPPNCSNTETTATKIQKLISEIEPVTHEEYEKALVY